jgi:hypothetical protein
MKIILFGATGWVGQGVLRECLRAPEVERVLVIGRSSIGIQDEKVREIVHRDFLDFSSIEDQLGGYDACFFCLGVSSVGMKERDYTRVTYDFTMAAAQVLAKRESGNDVYLCFRDGDGQLGTWAPYVGAGEREDRECAVQIAAQGLYVPSGIHSAAARNQVEAETVPDAFLGCRCVLPAVAEDFSEVCDDE